MTDSFAHFTFEAQQVWRQRRGRGRVYSHQIAVDECGRWTLFVVCGALMGARAQCIVLLCVLQAVGLGNVFRIRSVFTQDYLALDMMNLHVTTTSEALKSSYFRPGNLRSATSSCLF